MKTHYAEEDWFKTACGLGMFGEYEVRSIQTEADCERCLAYKSKPELDPRREKLAALCLLDP